MHGVIRHDNIFRKDLTLAGRDLIKVCARALMAGAARLNLHNSSAGAHAALTCDFIRHAGGRTNGRTRARNPHCRGYLNSYRPTCAPTNSVPTR